MDYEYDNLYRLVHEHRIAYNGGDPGVAYEYNFAYDDAGNRTSWQVVGGTTTNYTYDAANKMTAPGTFTYDDKGDTLTHVVGGVTTTYTWDYLNRMTQWQKTGETTQNYVYNAYGMRVSKTPSGGTTTNFLLVGPEVAEQIAGSTVTSYVGPGLISKISGTTRTVYHADGIGSNRAMSDGSQLVAEAGIYDAYGNLKVEYPVSSAPSLGYAGQYRYYSDSTGLHYLKERYYDPFVGRFLSRDPIKYGGGSNFYRYAFNNPVMSIDPVGLACTSTTSFSPWKTRMEAASLSVYGYSLSVGGPGGSEIGVGNGGAVGIIGEMLICNLTVRYSITKIYSSTRSRTTCKRCPCSTTCWTKEEHVVWSRRIRFDDHRTWTAGSSGWDPNAGLPEADCWRGAPAGVFLSDRDITEDTGEEYWTSW